MYSHSDSLLEIPAMLSVFENYILFFRFEIEIEPIFGTLALYDVKEKKKVLFCSSISFFVVQWVFFQWLSLCKTTYVMLISSLTNRISLVWKRSKWSCGLDHGVKTELKSLDVHFHYHLSFSSLCCFPLISIFPPTDLWEFLLWPELGSDERAA